MPLHRDEEHPYVYWSVPKSWFPGGMIFPKGSIPDLLQAIFSLPQGAARERLLQRVRDLAPNQGISDVASAIITHQASESEERFMPLIQHALAHKEALRIHYFTASRGDRNSRAISIQRIVNEPRRRLVAYCHRTKALRWFRIDGILKAVPDEHTAFQRIATHEIKRFIDDSVDGFHGGSALDDLAFSVRYPEARWIRNNLLPAMSIDEDGSSQDRLRVVCGSAGALVVARFIAGLGDIAEAEGDALRHLVAKIAAGALRNTRLTESNAGDFKTERHSSRLHSRGKME
jgi:predicted DNA-binding transcriptional regulator YafY